MTGDDRLDVMLSQELCDAGMVFAFAASIVQPIPADVEFLPAVDVSIAERCYREALRSTPSWIDQAGFR